MSEPESALRVEITALRRQTGAVRTVRAEVTLSDLEVTTARVREGRVRVDVTIENVIEGMVARGVLLAVCDGECRRCLETVSVDLDIEVREIFELHPTEGETWPISDDHVDLEPMVRESILLALPLTPLCRDDCLGPHPERFPTMTAADADEAAEPAIDPRWAALDELELDE